VRASYTFIRPCQALIAVEVDGESSAGWQCEGQYSGASKPALVLCPTFGIEKMGAMRRGSAVEYPDPRRDPHLNACAVCWPDLVCVVQ
jgi:hypothetical protein